MSATPQLISHSDLFDEDDDDDGGEVGGDADFIGEMVDGEAPPHKGGGDAEPEFEGSKWGSILCLALLTGAISILSEYIVNTIEGAAKSFRWRASPCPLRARSLAASSAV